MKTKIIACTVALLAGALASKAQSSTTSTGGTTWGIRAGVNFQNLNGKDASGDDLDYKLKTGFHIGLNAEIPIAPEFYVQPGVLFSTKGAKADDNADTKINISYIEIPVNFLYKPVLGTGKLLLGFGPYAGIGVSGKVKSDDGDADIEFKSSVSADDYELGKVYMKRMDFGANFLAGYEFSNKFSVQLNAQLGLVNLNTDIDGLDEGDAKTKNTGFGLSVGYRF